MDHLRREELIRLLLERDAEEAGGIRLTYDGQAPPWQIVRRVQPRRQNIEKKLSFGPEEEQSGNLVMDGENLQAMVSLYKYRGQIGIIMTDTHYNTCKDLGYNDKLTKIRTTMTSGTSFPPRTALRPPGRDHRP